MKNIIWLLTISVILGCSDKGSASDNPPAPNPTPGSLIADGKTDTYTIIKSSGYEYETPDNSGDHASEPFTHIKQAWDDKLGKNVFEFHIHIDSDDDRGLPNITDRQRNEIKTDSKSPAFMVGTKGQTHSYTWKFLLPQGMMSTKNFTHIHQLKGYGGNDIGNPLITLSVRKKTGGKEYLQVIYTRPAGGGNVYLAEVVLSDFLGQWVEVYEKATFDYGGKYSIAIKRVSDGKELVKVDTSIDLWRDGATAIRPKYGIYRSFGADGSLKGELRDEVLRFADFTLKNE